MPIRLDKSLAWRSATVEESAMLADLQGNILKGHGRHAGRFMFIRFSADVPRAKAFVHDMSKLVVSAHEQLRQSDAHKIAKLSGAPFVAFFLSFEGYRALGAEALAPTDEAFRAGMKSRAEILADPAVDQLDEGYREAIHAMVLIAGDPDDEVSWTSSAVDDLETKIANLLGGGGEIVTAEAGRAIFNAGHGGLEHFGYIDGRSQPLMLAEDIDAERALERGFAGWDPSTFLDQFLVKDPGSSSDVAFGSYFVFRKLEQNVQAFKDAEKALGEKLGIGELAGAMLVGRFEDGSPVELHPSDGHVSPIQNNFNYQSDPDGLKCPVHAHIRKTNPRGETSDPREKRHLMARRGLPYGRRDRTVEPTDEPSAGVGLLFMAYQADLRRQFEFTQQSWANNKEFIRPIVRPGPLTGIDPIIGQLSPGEENDPLNVPKAWNDAAAGVEAVSDFHGFVTMKGGEYFFAPARSTLAGI